MCVAVCVAAALQNRTTWWKVSHVNCALLLLPLLHVLRIGTIFDLGKEKRKNEKAGELHTHNSLNEKNTLKVMKRHRLTLDSLRKSRRFQSFLSAACVCVLSCVVASSSVLQPQPCFVTPDNPWSYWARSLFTILCMKDSAAAMVLDCSASLLQRIRSFNTGYKSMMCVRVYVVFSLLWVYTICAKSNPFWKEG